MNGDPQRAVTHRAYLTTEGSRSERRSTTLDAIAESSNVDRVSAREIDDAVSDLLEAPDALAELRWLAVLLRLISRQIKLTVPIALEIHTQAEVGHALGVSKQEISRKYKRAGTATAPARP